MNNISQVPSGKRVCHKCGIEPPYTTQWHLDYNDIGNWTGKWLCHKCYNKYDPYSSNNKQKLETLWRNKEIDKYSNVGIGFIGQSILAKKFNIIDCNIKTDNFNSKFDLYDPNKYGKIQVKTRTLNKDYGIWGGITLNEECNFDTLFIICMSNDMKNVERVYIIPELELYGERSITIYKDCSSPKRSRFERFRVDERSYNDTYHNLKLENCTVLKNK